MALVDIKIKKARIQDKPYRLYDEKGLFMVITPAGGKLWRWKYRFAGKEKLMSLGQYPEISLSMAREKLFELRRIHAQGQDPMALRKEEKIERLENAENSFQAVAMRWYEHWQVGKSPRYADSVLKRLQKDAFPKMGYRPIRLIETPEIVRLVHDIQNQREAMDIARRALEVIGQIFRFAIAHAIVSRNPVADIRPRDILKPAVTKNYARVSEKELPVLLRAIETYSGSPLTRLAIKLMALVFVRTSELIEARWEEIDWEQKRWVVPAERMKMRTPHIVPLSIQALEVLKTLQLISGQTPWLFPSEVRLAQTMSNNTILQALKRLGYHGKMTGHGFRGVASTILHEQGYNHDHIELQLAHAPRNAVSAAYNHALYLAPRAKMMQDWADYLDKIKR